MHSETLRCGLLGRTLGHSYSPAIHAQLAGYSYLLYEKEPEELEGFLRSGEFDGLNVTIPYKKTVIPYCAELSDTARAIGAVNTIVRRPDGTLWGGNTDAYGFFHAGTVQRRGGAAAKRRSSSAAAARRRRRSMSCGRWARGRSLSSRGTGRTIMRILTGTRTRKSP